MKTETKYSISDAVKHLHDGGAIIFEDAKVSTYQKILSAGYFTGEVFPPMKASVKYCLGSGRQWRECNDNRLTILLSQITNTEATSEGESESKSAREFWREKFDEYPRNDSEKLAVAMMQEYHIAKSQQTLLNEAVELLKTELVHLTNIPLNKQTNNQADRISDITDFLSKLKQ